MATIRLLQSVSGMDFTWSPGDLGDLPEDQARVWADGVRAELVQPEASAEEPVEPEASAAEPEAPAKARARKAQED